VAPTPMAGTSSILCHTRGSNGGIGRLSGSCGPFLRFQLGDALAATAVTTMVTRVSPRIAAAIGRIPYAGDVYRCQSDAGRHEEHSEDREDNVGETPQLLRDLTDQREIR
jgi:hypothetical protein